MVCSWGNVPFPFAQNATPELRPITVHDDMVHIKLQAEQHQPSIKHAEGSMLQARVVLSILPFAISILPFASAGQTAVVGCCCCQQVPKVTARSLRSPTCSSFTSRSAASLLACGNRSVSFLGWVTLQLSIMVAAKGLLMASRSSALGRPVSSMMRSSWFMVEEPGKMGLPHSSSPSMQPAVDRGHLATHHHRNASLHSTAWQMHGMVYTVGITNSPSWQG